VLHRKDRPNAGVRFIVAFVSLALLASIIVTQSLIFAASGDLDPSFVTNVDLGGTNYSVSDAVIQPDGKIIIAGNFATVNGQPRRGVARLLTDGSLDASFTSPLNKDSYDVALQQDGKILVGGAYLLGNQPLVRLNSDGSVDTSFSAPIELGYAANILLDQQGRIILIGDYSQFVGAARLLPDGSLDESFQPTLISYNMGAVLGIDNEGRLLLGGGTTQDGFKAIRRMLPDDTLDPTFNPVLLQAQARLAAAQPDGKILVTLNTSPWIQRLFPDGSPDTSFALPSNLISEQIVVRPIVQENGLILLVVRGKLIRLLSNGTLDTSFTQPTLAGAASVSSFKLQSDNKIIIVGNFSGLGTPPNSGIARLLNSTELPPTSTPPSCTIKRYTGDGSSVWGYHSRDFYPAGTTFAYAGSSDSSAVRAMVWAQADTITYLPTSGAPFTAIRSTEYSTGFSSTSLNNQSNWVEIKICGPASPPPQPTPTGTVDPCLVRFFHGDGTGYWGQSIERTLPAGTTFTLQRSAGNGARGMVFTDPSAITYLRSVGSSYTAPSAGRYKVGFTAAAPSGNTIASWVEIRICPPSGGSLNTAEANEQALGDALAEPELSEHLIYAPLILR
jgi:uncharacterized delta-60 repeat protein